MSKISRFTLDGNFISSYYFPNIVRDFVFANDHFVFIQPSFQNGDHIFKVLRSDTAFSNFEQIDLGSEVYDAVEMNYFHEFDGGFNFIPYMDNRVFQFKHDSVYERYSIINKGNSEIDYSKYKDFEDLINSESENNIYFDGVCNETDDYLYLNFRSKNDPFIELIWNKKDQSSFIINRKDRSLLRYVNIGSVHCEISNYLVGIIKPASLVSSLYPEYWWDGENPSNLLSQSQMDILNAVKEEDNPIVVLLKLKTL